MKIDEHQEKVIPTSQHHEPEMNGHSNGEAVANNVQNEDGVQEDASMEGTNH